MKTVLNGPGTSDRRLIANLAYHFAVVVCEGGSGLGGKGEELISGGGVVS